MNRFRARLDRLQAQFLAQRPTPPPPLPTDPDELQRERSWRIPRWFQGAIHGTTEFAIVDGAEHPNALFWREPGFLEDWQLWRQEYASHHVSCDCYDVWTPTRSPECEAVRCRLIRTMRRVLLAHPTFSVMAKILPNDDGTPGAWMPTLLWEAPLSWFTGPQSAAV